MENKIISSIKVNPDENNEELLKKIQKIFEANGFDLYTHPKESDEPTLNQFIKLN